MRLHLRAAVEATNLVARALLGILRITPMPKSEPPTWQPEPADACATEDPRMYHEASCALAEEMAEDRAEAHPCDFAKWERQMPLTAHDLVWQMEARS